MPVFSEEEIDDKKPPVVFGDSEIAPSKTPAVFGDADIEQPRVSKPIPSKPAIVPPRKAAVAPALNIDSGQDSGTSAHRPLIARPPFNIAPPLTINPAVDTNSSAHREPMSVVMPSAKMSNNRPEAGARIRSLPPLVPSPNRQKASALGSKMTPQLEAQLQQSGVNELVDTYAAQYGIEPELIKAMINQESGGSAKAKSEKGAQGLMQLMPATARMLGVTNPYEPKQNIPAGIRHFAGLMKRYDNNIELALAAYNAGAGAVDDYGDIPPFPETQNYVKSIMAKYKASKR